MAAALEFEKAGISCIIIEARNRTGGRCWSIRKGTVHTELSKCSQISTFDDDLYFNPGPARIPQHHITLRYCRELGVPIEPFVNRNYSAFLHSENSDPSTLRKTRWRTVELDLKGYSYEYASKSIQSDTNLTPEIKKRFLEHLMIDADLQPTEADPQQLKYYGGSRRGYSSPPDVRPGTSLRPFDLSPLLQSGYGNKLNYLMTLDQQTQMFQIQGGTDRLATALQEALKCPIHFDQKVVEVFLSAKGVRILTQDSKGESSQFFGPLCICTIPLPPLRRIKSNLPDPIKESINAISYAPAVKLGVQMKERFWELNDRIYGGITMTDLNATQVWYPSHGFHATKGVLLGAYNFSSAAEELGSLTPEMRAKRNAIEISKIHPEYSRHSECCFSVAWEHTPHSEGAWASYSNPQRAKEYTILQQGHPRFRFAGEHMSYLTGWMAGAFESALHLTEELLGSASSVVN